MFIQIFVFDVSGCKVQEGKRKINVEALLLSAQPVSTLQIVNPFSFITGVAVVACLCVIILFITIFIILQVRLSIYFTSLVLHNRMVCLKLYHLLVPNARLIF